MRAVRLFSFKSLYAGVAPHQARALYSVISYMDTVGDHREVDGFADRAQAGCGGASEHRAATAVDQ
ncbi:phytoene desaturase, partial [Streptomyces sp. NPDC051133]